jgi:hypothetical protein
MEDLLPLSRRQRLFDSLGFDAPLEFDRGDIGVPGGLQVLPHNPPLTLDAMCACTCIFGCSCTGALESFSSSKPDQ